MVFFIVLSRQPSPALLFSKLIEVERKFPFVNSISEFSRSQDPSATSAVIPLAAIFCKDVVGSKAANATGLSISKSMLPRADQDDRMRRREFLQFAGFVAIAAAKPLVAGAEQARQRRRVGMPHESGRAGGRGTVVAG